MKEPDRANKRLPGISVKLISLIPVFNWISLIILGKQCAHKFSMASGIIYGILTFANPDIALFIWIAVIVHYTVARRKIEAMYRADDYWRDLIKSTGFFSDIVIEGEEERIQPINKEKDSVRSADPMAAPHYTSPPETKFIKDMRKFAGESGKEVPFVPFTVYYPTYDHMGQAQRAWYFYWRTEARNGNYIDTDLSYLFIYIYELLSGIGWNNPKEGYDKLMVIWMEYRERHPKLDYYLSAWTFDFAWQHGVEYIEPEVNDLRLSYHQTLKNLLIDKHSEDRPLKLSFTLIDSLCSYSLTRSSFYKDGHQVLIQEAIPRAIALVDASLLKKENRGILSLYGPDIARKEDYYLYQSALCPDKDKRVVISVKEYTSSQRLCDYINEIVRFSENTLRAMYGYRGRLRGVTVEAETAALIEKFLKKEYGPLTEDKDDPTEKVEVRLDFDNIDELRIQSDAVRNALEVPEGSDDSEYIYMDQSENETAQGQGRESAADPVTEKLSDGLGQVIENLTAAQIEVLHIILAKEFIGEQLEKAAEEMMSMPEIMIDEINDVAIQYLDDVLIDIFDGTPCILEQYEEELNQAMK